MIKRRMNSLTCASAIFAAVGLSSVPTQQLNARITTHTFETEVREVRASTVNGQNRLLLEIDAVTGPTGCKSSSVILAAEHHNDSTQAEIEAVALQAFVNSESVVVSVPTELGHCINGKPVATDLKLMDVAAPFG